MKLLKNCPHAKFSANVKVNRLTNEHGAVTDFFADVKVECSDCKMPFSFLGMQQGLNGNKPTTDISTTEARLPIVPADNTLRMGSKVPGYSVQLIQ